MFKKTLLYLGLLPSLAAQNPSGAEGDSLAQRANHWLDTLVETCNRLLELPVAAIGAPRGRVRELLRDAALINVATHPLATIANELGLGSFFHIEFAVILAEIALYAGVTKLPPLRAIAIGLFANLASALVGLYFLG